MTLGSKLAYMRPELYPDWVEHLVKEGTWFLKQPLHVQGVAVCLSSSAMFSEPVGGRKDFQDQGEVTPSGG